MAEIICPKCDTEHSVEDYSSGDCSCGWHYYWDDGWDYVAEETLHEGCHEWEPGYVEKDKEK
jgi:hypothetical protein